jgi:hypothetical protein
MSVENEIRNFFNKKESLSEGYPGAGAVKETEPMMQGSSQKPGFEMLDKGAKAGNAVKSGVNVLKPGAGAKEDKPMKQGSSEDAVVQSHDDRNTQGKTQSALMKKDTTLGAGKGAGDAKNYSTVLDPSIINRVGNVMKNEDIEPEDEEIFISEEEFETLSPEEQAQFELVEMSKKDDEEEDEDEDEKDGEEKEKKHSKKAAWLKKMKEELAHDVESLFSSETDLSEDFKVRAASLFEAVVTARVANEIEELEDIVAEEASAIVAEMHEELMDKVDAYMNYLSEQWLEQNQVAIEEGLRAEVTEDFIAGLKVLFKEHYIEVPEEKYNVLGEMQETIESLNAQINESIAQNIELKSQLNESSREAVFVKATADLAQTEVEKLRGLVEDVEFENETIFEQKLNVIKTNYFPKSSPTSIVVESDAVITEEVSGTMLKYAEMIGRTSFGK